MSPAVCTAYYTSGNTHDVSSQGAALQHLLCPAKTSLDVTIQWTLTVSPAYFHIFHIISILRHFTLRTLIVLYTAAVWLTHTYKFFHILWYGNINCSNTSGNLMYLRMHFTKYCVSMFPLFPRANIDCLPKLYNSHGLCFLCGRNRSFMYDFGWTSFQNFNFRGR